MAYKRYLIEFGSGVVLHGGDVTLAAQRAIQDAVSHCCMCGLSDILGDYTKGMKLDVVIYVPYAERVNRDLLMKELKANEVNLEVFEGGLRMRGLHVEQYGPGDEIVLANAGITVWADVDI